MSQNMPERIFYFSIGISALASIFYLMKRRKSKHIPIELTENFHKSRNISWFSLPKLGHGEDIFDQHHPEGPNIGFESNPSWLTKVKDKTAAVKTDLLHTGHIKGGKLLIVMMGLPGRGKTYIARKVARYLRWISYRTRAFSLAKYRLDKLGSKSADFFDPSSSSNYQQRVSLLASALEDAIRYLNRGGEIAIIDGTNTTKDRRQMIRDRVAQEDGYDILWIESINNKTSNGDELDSHQLEELKNSPDFIDKDDYAKRLAHYKSTYETLEEDEGSFIKVYDGGQKLTLHAIHGFLRTKIVSFVMNLHTVPRPVYIVRHGESVFNVKGLVGGDSGLTSRGLAFAKALNEYLATEELGADVMAEKLNVWTSILRRGRETAQEIKCKRYVEWRALREIETGVCDGLSYEQVKIKFPEEYRSRNQDKLRYRYPRGESYLDVINRLEPVIFELERQQDPIIIVAHQAVIRCLYAYFLDLPAEEIPYLSIPLHTMIRLEAKAYGYTIMKQSPERIFFYVIDVMFAPNLVIRQVILILSLQATMIGSMALSKAMIDLVSNFTTKGRKMKKLQSMLENSKTYDEWVVVANELDVLYGYDKWRSEEYCPFFDYKSVSKRIRDTQDMMKKEDVFHLMFRLRGGLARDQYGIQHEGLFTRALAGTKHLVEKYHDTISSALERICDTQYDEDSIPTDAKLAFFNETRHAFGRTALLLSGGAFMGYYHLGVCKTLFQKHLLPRVISGASAGSLIAASVGTKTDEEFIITLSSREELLKNCYHFFKYSNEVKSETGRWLQYYTPKWLRSVVDPLLFFFFDKKFFNLDTEYFKSVVMDLAGLWTFQEAFDRTGRIINITVAPLNDYDPPRLLNYLTAPHVCVWSAAAASCALPGIFDSFQLIVKEPNGNYSPENLWTRQGHSDPDTQKSQGYSDGSLENDLPMKQLSELFNISHFIVSQVNPHSGLLSSLSMHTSVWSPALYGAVVSYIKFLQAQFRDWVKNVSNLLVSRSLAPVWSSKRGITQLLTQDYEGRSEDITIFPWKGHLSIAQAFLSVFKNPTEQEFLDVILAAERQTWPLLSRIQANLQVELTLDRCVQKLRKRVAEENENGLGIRQVMGVPEKTTIDRTPSFYTSRSIVNLSGLSVSDPLPYSSASHTMTPNIPSYIDYQQRLNNNVDDDALNLDVKGEDIPLAGDIPTFQHPGMKSPQHTIPKFLAPDGTRRRRRSNSNPMQYDSSNSNINGNNINTNININSNSTSTSTNTNSGNIGPLSMNEINLTEANVSNIPQTFGLNSPRRRNYSISSNDSNPGMYLSSTSQDQLDKYIDLLPESVSKDSRVKTTSMANFYYRSNTTSDDSLSKLK